MKKSILALLLAGSILVGGNAYAAEDNQPTPAIEEPTLEDTEDLKSLVLNQANNLGDEDLRQRVLNAETYDEVYDLYLKAFTKLGKETDEVEKTKQKFIDRLAESKEIPQAMKDEVIAKLNNAETLDEVNKIIANFNPQGLPTNDRDMEVNGKTYKLDYLGNIKGGFKEVNKTDSASHYNALIAKYETLKAVLTEEEQDLYKNKIEELKGKKDLKTIIDTHKDLNTLLQDKIEVESGKKLKENNAYLDECLKKYVFGNKKKETEEDTKPVEENKKQDPVKEKTVEQKDKVYTKKKSGNNAKTGIQKVWPYIVGVAVVAVIALVIVNSKKDLDNK